MYTFHSVAMDTFVSVKVNTSRPRDEVQPDVDRALGWFREVERVCSRFDPSSELSRLCAQVGPAVPVSQMLARAVEFALEVAGQTSGQFDPTVGQEMVARGFNRNYRTGQESQTTVLDRGASYRDVQLDVKRRTITLARPLLLDLGAVAKGLAIDLAAAELAGYADVAVEAGGDMSVRGFNGQGQPWRIGVRHPREEDAFAAVLQGSDVAVCTSGDYERISPLGQSHIVGQVADEQRVSSATVVAPTAMLADALSTAACAVGAEEGLRLLEPHGVEGLLVSASGELFKSADLGRYLA